MKIAYTPGVWDILHSGHINIINRAKLCGDYLVVGICSDRLTTSQKGTPATKEAERAKIVSELKSVNEVYVYDTPNQVDMLKLFNVDVFVIGEEFGKQGVPEHIDALHYCADKNIKIVRIPRTTGISSTSRKEGIIKDFWTSRADQLKSGTLGPLQSTSLTDSEQAAEERRGKDLKYILKAIKRTSRPKDIMLELGCGVGRVTFELAKVYKQVYANDYVQKFIDIAKEKQVRNIDFFCSEAHEFDRNIPYDCCVIAGLFVCLSDQQLEKVVQAISNIPCLVIKESVGTFDRYELKEDHYSEQLRCNYTAIYRKTTDIIDMFSHFGYITKYTEVVDLHRRETHLRVFLLEKI